MSLTVGKLRKALDGLPDNMPVYTADHDHAEWETNGIASEAIVRNQKEMSLYAKEQLRIDSFLKIEGNYLVIKV